MSLADDILARKNTSTTAVKPIGSVADQILARKKQASNPNAALAASITSEKGFGSKILTGAINVIDKLNTASYAVGGMIKGVGAFEGIKQKISPSRALDIKNPVIGFGVDVLTDPLTWLTFGSGAAAKGAINVGGKTLSKIGAQELAKIEAKEAITIAAKLNTTVDKLGLEALDQARNAAKLKIANQLAKNPDLVQRIGVGIGVPFTGIEKQLVQLPKIADKVLGRVGEKIALTKPMQILGKTFQGDKYAIQTSDALSIAQKERAIQKLDDLRTAFVQNRGEVVDALKTTLSKTGESAFNKAADFIEAVPKATATKVIREASLKVDDDIAKGLLNIDEGNKIKIAIQDLTTTLQKNEKSLIEMGLLDAKRVTKELNFVPRAKDIEKTVIGSSSKLLPDLGLKGRVIKKLETSEGTVFAKLGDRGKIATLITGEKAGQTAKFISQDDLQNLSKKISKTLDAKIAKIQNQIDTLSSPSVLKSLGTKANKMIESRQIQIKKLTEEAEKQIKELSSKYKGGDVFVKDGKIFKAHEATAAEIQANTAIKYVSDIAEPVAKTLLRSKNAITAENFVRDITKETGELSPMGAVKIGKEGVKEGYTKLEAVTGLKSAKGYQVPNVVAEILKGHFRVASSDDELNMIGKAFDEVTRYWKAFALVGLQYHTRNAVSNTYNAWLAGLRNPKRYADALKLQMGGDLTKAEKEIVEQARKLGVTNNTFFSAEIVQSIKEELKGASWNPLSTRSYLVKASQNVGQAIENNQRLALFIDRIAKGDTVSDAARTVKKYLFDYNDLTAVEKGLFKRIAPFYTWMRKNLPLQLETLITHPGKAASTEKFLNIVQPKDAEEVKENLPQYLKDGHPVVLPWKNAKGENLVINAEGLLPVYDLNNIANLKFKDIIDMVNPVLKVPFVEIPFNMDIFKNFKEIDDSKGRVSLYRDLFRAPFSDESVRGKMFWGMFSKAQEHVIKTAYRPLREIDNLLQPGRVDAETASIWERVLGAVFIKAQAINVEKQKGFNEYIVGETKDKSIEAYTRAYKRFLNYENKLDMNNIKILEKSLKELGISEKEIQAAQVQAIRQDLKYNKLTKDNRREIEKELQKTYKRRGEARRVLNKMFKDQEKNN